MGPSISTHPLVHRRVQSTLFEKKGLVVLLADVNTRVAGVGIDDERPGSGKTVCVLVENDVTLILDELF